MKSAVWPNDDGRYAGLSRILRVAKYVESSPIVSVKRVAEAVDVHPRTARRYLMALEAAGWDVPPWRSQRNEF